MMEREEMKIKMKSENDIEMRVSVVETILIEYIKRKSKNAIRIIKTEVEDEEEINKLENHALEQDLVHHSKMTEMEKEIEALKQKAQMDNRTIEELRSRVSESEIREQNLREYNTEANQTIEELRRRISVCEEEKKTAEISLRKSENVRCVEDLRRRLLACKEEKKTDDRVREEMKVRETECLRRLEDLERQKSEADDRVKEMKARESDLRRQLLETDRSVKELKGRSLEACKLLRMNELETVKVKFVCDDDGEGLISVPVVSVGFENGATSMQGGEDGPIHVSNPLELTISEQSTKSKKRYSPDSTTTTTPSSVAAEVIDWPVIPTRKRSKHSIRANHEPLIIKRKGILFGANMVRAFEKDDELCLHAVCALYRQHVSTLESTECPNRVLYHFEALRGCALASYLTAGDPEFRLTISVDEVKQRYPDVVKQCRRLAINYSSYFTEMPRAHGPRYRSLALACCHVVGACETCWGGWRG